LGLGEGQRSRGKESLGGCSAVGGEVTALGDGGSETTRGAPILGDSVELQVSVAGRGAGTSVITVLDLPVTQKVFM